MGSSQKGPADCPRPAFQERPQDRLVLGSASCRGTTWEKTLERMWAHLRLLGSVRCPPVRQFLTTGTSVLRSSEGPGPQHGAKRQRKVAQQYLQWCDLRGSN